MGKDNDTRNSTYNGQWGETCFTCFTLARVVGTRDRADGRGGSSCGGCPRCRPYGCARAVPTRRRRLGLGYRAAPAVPAMWRSGVVVGLAGRLSLPAMRSGHVPTSAAADRQGKTVAGNWQGEGGMTDRPAYTVTLRATGDGPPAAVRLRRFLKAALRQYGLRCIGCEEVTQRTADRMTKRARA